MTHAAVRYLEAKRSVDDRALAPQVVETLREALPPEPRILEAGCGTGTMVPRLVEWGVDAGTYRGVDSDPGVIDAARYLRPRELRHKGHEVVKSADGFEIDALTVAFETGDALTAFQEEAGADLFVAACFADLVPIEELLAVAESAVAPGGLVYLPHAFDGGTIFQPDHPADERIEAAYHEAIEAEPGRDPYVGRHLAAELAARPGRILEMAAADWIVRPDEAGYPHDERYFLSRILDFGEAALADADASLPDLDDWLRTRREQLAAGELIYVAHQYDLLYRLPES